MNLNEIPTPISEKIAYEATTRTVGKWVVPFAKCQDLERKLATCRDTLSAINNAEILRPDIHAEITRILTVTVT